MKKKLIFTITFLLSCISYMFFLKGYYSIDSLQILSLGYMGYGMQYSLFDGRIFMFFICCFANLINMSLKNCYIILLICSIFVSSISVLKIYEIIINIKKTKNKWIDVLIFLSSYCYIFHFMYIDNMQFIECLIISISVLFHIISAQKIILQNKKLQGFVFCFLAILFYQGTFNIFITTAFLFILIQKNQNSKEKIKKTFISMGILACAIFVDLIIISVIKNNLNSIQSTRLTFSIIKNISTWIYDLPELIFNSLSLFPSYLHFVMILIVFIIMYIYCIKNKEIISFYYVVFLTLVCYASTLLLGIVYRDIIHIINGRVFTSVGSSISVLFIFTYLYMNIFEEKFFFKILSGLIVCWFLANIFNTIYITSLLKDENNIDKQLSYQIKSEIEKYEKETENKITKIAIRFRIDLKNAKVTKIHKSTKKLAIYNNIAYELYTNQKLEKIIFNENQSEINNLFNPGEEKIVCIGDTVYVQAICF